MRYFFIFHLSFFLFVALCSIQAQTSATIYPKSGPSQAVYIRKSEGGKVTYLLSQTSSREFSRALSEIRRVDFTLPSDFKRALNNWKRGEYVKAIEQFSTIEKKYKGIANIPGNFFLSALYYKGEALRRTNQFEKMQQVKSYIEKYTKLLDAETKAKVSLWNAWLQAEKQQWQELEQTLLPYMRETKASITSQVAYLQSLALKQTQSKNEIPQDYLNALYATITLDPFNAYGVFQPAALQILESIDTSSFLQSRQLELNSAKGVAKIFVQQIGKKSLPPKFHKYLSL